MRFSSFTKRNSVTMSEANWLKWYCDEKSGLSAVKYSISGERIWPWVSKAAFLSRIGNVLHEISPSEYQRLSRPPCFFLHKRARGEIVSGGRLYITSRGSGSNFAIPSAICTSYQYNSVYCVSKVYGHRIYQHPHSGKQSGLRTL